MSLINWLTDYIYTPLLYSFRKMKLWGVYLALMLTFLISGIWHGAAVSFIVWGLVQGLLLCIEATFHNKRTQFESKYHLRDKWWYILLCCTLVYLLFSFSQIFGKCVQLSDAWLVIGKIFGSRGSLYYEFTTFGYGLTMLFLLFLKDFIDEFFPGKFALFNSKNILIRYTSYIIILFLILGVGVLDSSQFIYFQF